MRKSRVTIGVVALLLIIAGCATLDFYKDVDSFMTVGKFSDASNVIEAKKANYKGESELLYYCDKGTMLQLAGKYADSTKMFEEADLKIDELYKKSITKEAMSLLTNDLTLPYGGEDFEQVMVNVMKALNYMYMGDYSGAQVEARKVNNRLNLLSDIYEGKNIYKDDAFARYISAFCWEAGGGINDAFIDYKKSLENYIQYVSLYGTDAAPEQVVKDAYRTAEALGFSDKIEELKAVWGDIPFIRKKTLDAYGEILFVVYDGLAPFKKSYFVDTVIFDEKKNPYNIKIAYPQFVARNYMVEYIEANNGDTVYRSAVAEDITKIAVKNLENKNILIAIKAIARATTKFFAGKTLVDSTQGNLLASVMANVYNFASEQADTRSWRTLPARFHVMRMPVTPGKRNIQIRIISPNGNVRNQDFNVKIKQGQKICLPVYCF